MSESAPEREKEAEERTGAAAGKKVYSRPQLTRYGTIKDVYKGPSCFAGAADAVG
ncbi:MAG: hypothetical protein AB1742_10540 [bacterium]